jgi:hypothetical protein
MPIEFRPAHDHDFEYCGRLYFVEMTWIIEELHLDRIAQESSLQLSSAGTGQVFVCTGG